MLPKTKARLLTVLFWIAVLAIFFVYESLKGAR